MELVQGSWRRHSGVVGALQPGQRVPDLSSKLAQPALNLLALQMGHIIVELGSQREQRPAGRTPG